MKKSRVSEQQRAYIPKQADERMSVQEVCRKAGVSEVVGGTTADLRYAC